MEIRKLKETEKPAAMHLVWRVFQEFEAPEYKPEGIHAFHDYITDQAAVAALTVYGAFIGERLVGTLAIREGGTHISLFFVDPDWHCRGVGKVLFQRFLADSAPGTVTVNSSPYAVEIYSRLGFRPVGPERVDDGIRYTPMVYRCTLQDGQT